MKKKLAIITTHPIQYNAPLFRLLSERGVIDIKVFYTWSQTEAGTKYDPGFKQNISWDIPLLEGYPYVFSKNISATPGSHHRKGIDNPFLIKEIEEWKAGAILVYGWNFISHKKAMKHFYGRIPVLFRGDSTLLDEQPGIKKLLRRLYLRRIFSTVDIALYAGSANKAYFTAHGLKEKQLVFMPHAIDNDRFSPGEQIKIEAKKLREGLNIPANAQVFLFAGKLEEKKQPDLLARLFDEIKSEDAWLVIAGSGEMEEELRSLYSDNKYIRFIGFQNQQQMPALYAACDVFVLPSKGPGETWGLSVNEAMAAGKAIIISDACGAAADLVKAGINGFVFNRHDEAALKLHLSFFCENKTAAKEMGNQSRIMIKKYNFSTDASALEDAVNRSVRAKA